MNTKQITGQISIGYIYRQKKIIAEAPGKIEELSEQLHNKPLFLQLPILEKMIHLHSEITYAQNALAIAEKVNRIKIFKAGSRTKFHQQHLNAEPC